jgi:hypothetical protein
MRANSPATPTSKSETQIRVEIRAKRNRSQTLPVRCLKERRCAKIEQLSRRWRAAPTVSLHQPTSNVSMCSTAISVMPMLQLVNSSMTLDDT